MKKTMNIFSSLIVSTLLLTNAQAQTQQSESSPRPLADKKMGDRLQKDLSSRSTNQSNQPFNWFENNDGFYTNYSQNNVEYMSRYDKQGNYIESMKKGTWNEQVPAELRSSFDKSQYRTQDVTGYWEVSDRDRKGYYMELKDDKGQMTKVWADDKNQFSSTPYKSKPKN